MIAKLRGAALNLLSLAIGCVIAAGLLEVLLRIHNPFQARIKGDRIVLESNKQYTIQNNIIDRLEPQIHVARNSVGFRGPNPPPDMANWLSLITIGGSTTQCFFLSEGKTWPDQLAARLGPHFKNFWVNNAGLDGHSTYGHVVLLEDQIVKLKPKMILLLVGANDLGRDPGSEWDSENVKGQVSFRSVTAFIKSMSPHSEVASLMANLFRSMNAHKRGLLHQKVDITKLPMVDFTAEQIAIYRATTLEPRYLKGFRDRLETIVKAGRANGIEPILMTQPTLLGKGVDPVTKVDLERVLLGQGGSANGRMWWDVMEEYNDVTRGVARDRNVKLIDLARKLEKSSLYFYDTIHFSNEGAVEIARIIAAELCDLMTEKYPTFVTAPCRAAKGQ